MTRSDRWRGEYRKLFGAASLPTGRPIGGGTHGNMSPQARYARNVLPLEQDPDTRAVLAERVGGMSNGEIAEHLGVSRSRIEQIMAEVLRKVRGAFEPP